MKDALAVRESGSNEGPAPAGPSPMSPGIASPNSAAVSHRRPSLRERPAVPLEIGGHVGAVAVLVDRLDDRGTLRLRPGEVLVEVIDEDPGHVSGRIGFGSTFVPLEHN